MQTTETRVTPLASALALAVTLLVAAGCDGGIFGTGDGTPSGGEPPFLASPDTMSPDSSAADSAADTAGSGGAGLPEIAGPDGVTGPPPKSTGESLSSLVLVNTLITDPSATGPRLRIVNASAAGVSLRERADAENRVDVPFVAAGTASPYVTLPDGVSRLFVERRVTADAEAETAQELGPFLLDDASVTTLLVREADAGIAVTDLPTLVSTDDRTLALVRIVTGDAVGRRDDGDAMPITFTLVPDGADPGGVEVAFEGETSDADGMPSMDYRAVPAGDYRLERSDAGAASRVMSFRGGTVRTLVASEGRELLVVDDGG